MRPRACGWLQANGASVLLVLSPGVAAIRGRSEKGGQKGGCMVYWECDAHEHAAKLQKNLLS